MWDLQERDQLFAEGWRGIDIDPTVKTCQSTILVGTMFPDLSMRFPWLVSTAIRPPFPKCLWSYAVERPDRYSESQFECRT